MILTAKNAKIAKDSENRGTANDPGAMESATLLFGLAVVPLVSLCVLCALCG
jgi:hypothetical protein